MNPDPGDGVAELPPRRRALFVALLLLLCAGLLVLGLELYARFFSANGYYTPRTLAAESMPFVSTAYARTALAPRVNDRLRLSQGSDIRYRINSRGYRGRDFEVPKPAGTIRFLVYGGSGVFDILQGHGDDWPHRIERALRADGCSNCEVLNAGIPGHGSLDSLARFLTEGHELDPDVVLLYNAWNDLKHWHRKENPLRGVKPFDPRDNPFTAYQNPLDEFLCEYSQLFVRVRRKYYERKLGTLGTEGLVRQGELLDRIPPRGPRQFEVNVRAFVDAVRAAGATPVLVSQVHMAVPGKLDHERLDGAYRYSRLKPEVLARAFARCREAFERIARETGARFLDAGPEFSGRPELIHDHMHLTTRGSEALADWLAPRLPRGRS